MEYFPKLTGPRTVVISPTQPTTLTLLDPKRITPKHCCRRLGLLGSSPQAKGVPKITLTTPSTRVLVEQERWEKGGEFLCPTSAMKKAESTRRPALVSLHYVEETEASKKVSLSDIKGMKWDSEGEYFIMLEKLTL